MGVLNVTPDSFSDGGRYLDSAAAIEHGLAMVADGADLVDVGGESTRPGAARIPESDEAARVLDVVRGLAEAGVVVSIDTMRATVAAAAVEAGAQLVNDVSGGLADPAMADFVASIDLPYIAMHWRGFSTEMERLAEYDDVVSDVRRELAMRLDSLAGAGVDLDRVVIDPGLGFAKRTNHDWALVTHLEQLRDLGYPLLVGASRKRMTGAVITNPDGSVPAAAQRDAATAALSALVATRDVWCVRVHDVGATLAAVRVAAAWNAAQSEGES